MPTIRMIGRWLLTVTRYPSEYLQLKLSQLHVCGLSILAWQEQMSKHTTTLSGNMQLRDALDSGKTEQLTHNE